MKRSTVLFLVIALLVGSFCAFSPEPQYVVKRPVNRWQQHVSVIQGLKNVAGNPKATHAEVLELQAFADTLINDIVGQVNPQLPKDTTKKK